MAWPEHPDCSGGHRYAHMDEHTWRPPQEPTPERSYVPFRTCSFCGSMHPEDLLGVLHDPEAVYLSTQVIEEMYGPNPRPRPEKSLEWADMKYGYPHKLYVHLPHGAWGKFYTSHLKQLDDHEFELLSDAIAKTTGIRFTKKDGAIHWLRRRGLEPAESK